MQSNNSAYVNEYSYIISLLDSVAIALHIYETHVHMHTRHILTYCVHVYTHMYTYAYCVCTVCSYFLFKCDWACENQPSSRVKIA